MRKLVKRAVNLVLLSSIIFFSMPLSTFAESNNQQVLEKEAIKNYDSEIKNSIDSSLEKKIENHEKPDQIGKMSNGKGKEYLIPIYYIAEEELLLSNGNELLAQTYVYALPDTESKVKSVEETAASILAAASTVNGSTSLNSYDPAGSLVRGFCTIYYTINTDASGAKTYKLNSVSGNYTRGDTSFSVSKQSVMYGEVGIGPQGAVNSTSKVTPTASSWSYSTGYTKYIGLDVAHTFGASYTLTVSRSSSSWTFKIQNLL